MKFTLLVVGRTVEKHYITAIDDYVARTKHFTQFDMEVIPELKNTKSLSMEQQKEKCQQTLQLTVRKHLEVNGIIDVIRFDELAVVLQSVCGELTIEGNGLKMSVLDTDKGIVSLDGQVDSIYYSEDTGDGKKGLFGRIFN